jgi:predicted MFS family arabinose efflux permease
VAVRERGNKAPYRYTLPATACGLVLGWALGGWLGWDPLFTAIGVELLASVVVEAIWLGEHSGDE